MRRIFTSIISLFWSVAFGFTAMEMARAGFTAKPAISGSVMPYGEISGLGGFWADCCIAGFALASVLFAWSAATSALEKSAGWSESDEVARNAFSVGALMIAVAFAIFSLQPLENVIPVFALQLVALAACYVAVVAECHHSKMLSDGNGGAQREFTRRMAIEAGYHTLLPRLVIGGSNRNGSSK